MASKKQLTLLSFFKKETKPETDTDSTVIRSRAMKPKQCSLTKSTPSGKKRFAAGVHISVMKSPSQPKSPDNKRMSPSAIKTGTPKRRRVILSDSENEEEVKVQAMEFELGGSGVDSEKQLSQGSSNSDKLSSQSPKSAEPPNKFENFESLPGSQNSGKAQSTTHTKRRCTGEIAQSFINSFRSTNDELDTSTATLDRSMYRVDHGDDVKEDDADDDADSGRFIHLDFDFLKPDHIRDANGRYANDLDYCPRTLYVPESFMKKQTPGHRQWWAAKSAYFDTVLFFKVGKFYEMYHMDAVIGVENLNLTYMRGNHAHCGFPEIAFGRFADQLVNRGYKVARIEQTETPTQLENRNKSQKGNDKVVRRFV